MITNDMIIRRAMMDDKLQGKEGTQIACEKCKGSKFSGMKLYGKNTQKTTTGAQLLDIKRIIGNAGKIVSTQYENYIITIQGIYAEGDTNAWRNVRILLDSALAGKTITASIESAENDAGEPLRVICDINYAMQNGSTSWNYFGVDNPKTIAIPAEATSLACRIHIIENTSGSAEYGTYITTVKGLMVSIGDKVLPWEPYTGGVPSPSPDYPQEIESIGMKWSTGANLVDVHNAIKFNTYGLETTVKDDGTIVISGTSSSNAKNLSFSFLDNKFSFPLTSIFKLFDVEEKNCKLSSVRRTNASDATNNKIAIDINQINSGNPIYCSFKLVVSEKAVEEYEPYTGGVPKPYGDKIGVNVHGKNLIPFPYQLLGGAGTKTEQNGVTYTVQEDGGVRCIGTPNSVFGVSLSMMGFSDKPLSVSGPTDGKVVLSGGPLYFDPNNKRLFFFFDTKQVGNPIDTIIYPQIEIGTVATPYEPYHEPQFASIATPNGLPGIPVSSGGNYIDADGRQWICDEIDLARGVYVQRVAFTTVDGNAIKFKERGEFWNLPDGSAPGCYDTNTVINNFFSKNMFGANGRFDFVYTLSTNMKKYFKTPDELNEFCKNKYDAGTPLTLYYALTTPIETPLTDEQIAAYKQLHTYADSTAIISNDANAYMGVTYRRLRD